MIGHKWLNHHSCIASTLQCCNVPPPNMESQCGSELREKKGDCCGRLVIPALIYWFQDEASLCTRCTFLKTFACRTYLQWTNGPIIWLSCWKNVDHHFREVIQSGPKGIWSPSIPSLHIFTATVESIWRQTWAPVISNFRRSPQIRWIERPSI